MDADGFSWAEFGPPDSRALRKRIVQGPPNIF